MPNFKSKIHYVTANQFIQEQGKDAWGTFGVKEDQFNPQGPHFVTTLEGDKKVVTGDWVVVAEGQPHPTVLNNLDFTATFEEA